MPTLPTESDPGLIKEEFERLRGELERLRDQYASIWKLYEEEKKNNQKDRVDQIATALGKAQGQMEIASKDKNNPFFKSAYADLASINTVAKKPLAENDLSIVQLIIPSSSEAIIKTILMHKSGQTISSQINLKPVKTDPQAFGSAYTYCRRFSLQALLNISSEDDDGNAASNNNHMNEEFKTFTNTNITTLPKRIDSMFDHFKSKYDIDKIQILDKIGKKKASEIDLGDIAYLGGIPKKAKAKGQSVVEFFMGKGDEQPVLPKNGKLSYKKSKPITTTEVGEIIAKKEEFTETNWDVNNPNDPSKDKK